MRGTVRTALVIVAVTATAAMSATIGAAAATRPTPPLRLRAARLVIGSGGGATTTTQPPATTGPTLAGCPVFPSNNWWNRDISTYSVRSDSAAIISEIQGSGGQFLHADFGGGGAYGIPFITVPATQPKVAINYTAYGDESDPGPFPIPGTAPVEGGSASTGDRHVIAVQRGTCRLYELYGAYWRSNHWDAGSGATWSLTSNALRPAGWTSADAAGLPILPGLARYDEVTAGVIKHALRVTFSRTRHAYVTPARHYASSSTDPTRPAMGMRLRLKASYDLSRFHGEALVIMRALKRYGLIVADNGSNWYITGASDPRWNDSDLDQLKTVPGSAFEVVNTGPLVTS
jgi:hypothetical protein